jgi:hypothetical protein
MLSGDVGALAVVEWNGMEFFAIFTGLTFIRFPQLHLLAPWKMLRSNCIFGM